MYSRSRSMEGDRGRGAKKGAHYSLPRRTRAATPAIALLAALFGAAGPAPGAVGPPKPDADAKKTEAQLAAVRAEIERVTREVSQSQVEHDRVARELRGAELSVGEARDAWLEVRRQRAEGAARRAQLATEEHAREQELADNRAALAGQMRAAYQIGRQEPLKLLLNQKDPALAGRMFAYYSYFGRARAGQIKLIEDDVTRIAELTGELAAADLKLAELEGRQKAQLGTLEAARERRTQVLATLEAQSHTR